MMTVHLYGVSYSLICSVEKCNREILSVCKYAHSVLCMEKIFSLHVPLWYEECGIYARVMLGKVTVL